MTEEDLLKPQSLTDHANLESDLGFGSVVAGQKKQRLLNRDGSFNVHRTGMSSIYSLNLYHWLLSMSWASFLGLVLLLYFVSNILFGAIYASFGFESLVDSSAKPETNLFFRGFFFSVQTFATIGYGTIHPVGRVPNLLVTVESYYSLLANALITGVVFARFAKPTAKIKFSKHAVIAPYQNGKGLMFRIVNARRSQLIEVKVQVMIARFITENGQVRRRFDTLTLERPKVAFFPLSWTIVHPIDERSPLFSMEPDDYIAMDAELLILLTGIDETFAQSVHTRSSYKPNEILCGRKFVNIYNEVSEGEPISIDIRKLSQTEPV